jgi:multidrug efflux pump subunit AcrA (membrane-fusion protein)
MKRILLWLLMAAVVSQAEADAPSPEQLKEAEKRKASAIATLEARIEELDGERKESVRKGKLGEAKRLAGEIKAAKAQLSTAAERQIEDYAQEIVKEYELAEKQRRDREDTRRAELEKIERLAEQKKAEEAKEQERKIKSGNCPLRFELVNFHNTDLIATRLLIPDADGPRTVVIFEVKNMADSQVIAYEVQCEFMDGFDRVVGSKAFVGTTIAPGESKKSVNGIAPIDLAVQMKITAERIKLEDGTEWKREPHHRLMGKIVKKLDGAEIRVGR